MTAGGTTRARRLLAADIGGTKTLIGLFHASGSGPVEQHSQRIANAGHAGFAEVLATYLAAFPGERIDAACFAVAGPVADGAVSATNIPWHLEERALAAALGVPAVRLVNDLVATARGMLVLPPEAFAGLNEGRAVAGNAAVLAVGTGLGQAILHWTGGRHVALATEGGHTDFAPQSETEIELLRHMQRKYRAHVSWERLLSGPGLAEIYLFLRERSGVPEPDWLAQALAGHDPAPAVAAAALEGRDAVCAEAVTMFARLLGAEAGNLALKCLAVGGVYIGGGIAPKILPFLRDGAFMAGFAGKGRFGTLLSQMPVRVALESRAGLLGAAEIAAELEADAGPAGAPQA